MPNKLVNAAEAYDLRVNHGWKWTDLAKRYGCRPNTVQMAVDAAGYAVPKIKTKPCGSHGVSPKRVPKPQSALLKGSQLEGRLVESWSSRSHRPCPPPNALPGISKAGLMAGK